MSVKKEASGRRSVQVEIEVPGTPEEVWQAIATGPGVSSWFLPTEIKDGVVTTLFGPGMEDKARVTAYEPPHRFAAESAEIGPGGPPVGTEWLVESRSGDVCVVRVVHSLFASTDEWDNQLESYEGGWPTWFLLLRQVLTHFRGQRCTAFQVTGTAPETVTKAWERLTGALGLAGAVAGQRVRPAAGAPALQGAVVEANKKDLEYGFELLRLEAPARGLAFFMAHDKLTPGTIFVGLHFYFFGDPAEATAAREKPLWQAWMEEHFPMAGDAAPGA